MFRNIQDTVALLNQEYLQSFRVSEESRIQDLQKICHFLKRVCEEQHTVFVQGRGRRKSRNQKYLEMFRRFLGMKARKATLICESRSRSHT